MAQQEFMEVQKVDYDFVLDKAIEWDIKTTKMGRDGNEIKKSQSELLFEIDKKFFGQFDEMTDEELDGIYSKEQQEELKATKEVWEEENHFKLLDSLK